MDLLKALSELPAGVKILLSVISAPFAIWLALLKAKKGFVSLSKARTERLYEIMLRDDASTVPSGALTMAVKGAMDVELEGDRIRFALQHDNPLFVLRAFKSTLGDVKMSPDGRTCLDARSNPWLSLQAKKKLYIGILIAVYAVLVVGVFIATVFLKETHAPWLGYIFLGNYVAIPLLVWRTLKVEMARKLVAPLPGEMRRPASSLNTLVTPAVNKETSPAPPSPFIVVAEATPRGSEDHEKREDAMAGEVTGAIEKAIDAVRDGGEQAACDRDGS